MNKTKEIKPIVTKRMRRWKRFCWECRIDRVIHQDQSQEWWINRKIKKSCCGKKECWYFLSSINDLWEKIDL